METPDLIRLLMPAEDGEPVYKEHLQQYDVNEDYGDHVLVEVLEDDPNIDWLLQDPEIVQVGYSQPATERDGAPTDIIRYGTNGPPRKPEERATHHRNIQRPKWNNLSAPTVYDPENEPLEAEYYRIVEVDEDDLPDFIQKLSPHYDISQGILKEYEVTCEGDGVPISYVKYYIFAEEKLGILTRNIINEPYRGTDVRRKQIQFVIEDYKENGIQHSLIYAPEKVMENPSRSFSKAPQLPNDSNSDYVWWYREEDF